LASWCFGWFLSMIILMMWGLFHCPNLHSPAPNHTHALCLSPSPRPLKL
jgi:hypothetical protein